MRVRRNSVQVNLSTMVGVLVCTGCHNKAADSPNPITDWRAYTILKAEVQGEGVDIVDVF